MMPAVAWAGGGAFIASLAYFVYTYAITLGKPAGSQASLPQAALIDVLLFTAFAVHHSLFARPWLKRRIVRFVPVPLERSFFVWVASVLLAVVCAAWQPLPGLLYAHSGWLALPHVAAVVAGLLLTALGARELSPLELAGIEQARRRPKNLRTFLVTSFPYNLVRHPIYLGWVLVVFGVPRMTASRLLMASISAAYLAIAIRWEEGLLFREFGARYLEYAQRVRWRMIPGLY